MMQRSFLTESYYFLLFVPVEDREDASVNQHIVKKEEGLQLPPRATLLHQTALTQ